MGDLNGSATDNRSFYLTLAVLCCLPVIGIVVWGVWLRLSLGPMEMPPLPIRDTSEEAAYAALAPTLSAKWGIRIVSRDRILHAAWDLGNADCYYLLEPSEEFDYDAFREAILGEMKVSRRGTTPHYIDDDDSSVGKGSGGLSWWEPSALANPDVVQVMLGSPEGPKSRLWYFAISREDGLIYIWHDGQEVVRADSDSSDK